MGRCLVALLHDHCDLTVCSRELRRARKVAGRVGASAAGAEGCSDQDIVFLAVPNANLLKMAEKISRTMPAGSLLVDISSVKCGVIEKVEGVIPPKVHYISIHPLFSSPGANEKNTIIVPVFPGNWATPFRELLLSSGMKLTEVGAEEHDRIMAAVQVLHHFSLLSMKAAFVEMGFPRESDLRPFTTRSLKRTLGVLRLLERNIETIEMIQRENKFARQARERFIEEAKKLDEHYNKDDNNC
jgi:prephenate dehydrogenase